MIGSKRWSRATTEDARPSSRRVKTERLQHNPPPSGVPLTTWCPMTGSSLAHPPSLLTGAGDREPCANSKRSRSATSSLRTQSRVTCLVPCSASTNCGADGRHGRWGVELARSSTGGRSPPSRLARSRTRMCCRRGRRVLLCIGRGSARLEGYGGVRLGAVLVRGAAKSGLPRPLAG